jgi:ATP phosphoribosyltransferase regulatory subunit
VLHTRGDPLEKTRSPMQIGAELYGHAGKASDLEVISLMLEMLALTGLQNVHLDLGHVGIYRALAHQAGLNNQQEKALFDVLQRKAKPELQELISSFALTDNVARALLALPELNGDASILQQAQQLFSAVDDAVQQALAELRAIAEQLAQRFPYLAVSFDLAELRGYHYHTGMVFAAFVPTVGREIARGGRYDNIGAQFGRARPATGFSADLKVLSALSKQHAAPAVREAIFAAAGDDAELHAAIRDLRAAGRVVIQQLPEQQGGAADYNCTALLHYEQQGWVVKPL